VVGTGYGKGAVIIQTPLPTQTFMQQITPYLVTFVGVLMLALGYVVKAYAEKIVTQLKMNHEANILASKTTDGKVDTVIRQTNGVNEKLQEHIAQQAEVIVALRANPSLKIPPGDIAT
jgi:hypothetical protein